MIPILLNNYHKRPYTTLIPRGNIAKSFRHSSLTRIDIIRGLSTGRKNDEKPVKSRMGMLATAGLGASFLFGKMKFVLIALKLTKAAPLASMVITSFAYSFFFGWPYAVGMVSLIFFHECGHAIVMRHYGVPFSPMVFIPFMGAVIAMKERPKNSYEEAIIAFGGPVVGSIAALGVSTGGVITDSQLLYALADWGFMINLFNLMPIGSLDGGRIGSAIHPYMNSIGLVGGGALIYYNSIHNPIFYLIMLSGTYTTVSRIFGWDEEEGSKDYYKIGTDKQGGLFGAYIALIASLVLAMKENDKHRKTPRQLQHEQDYGDGGGQWKEDTFGNKDGVYDDFFPTLDDNENGKSW
eukprot:CAMPEP_0119034218 /NCGR_PEP_ID=MMETSP1177-20130426/1231_1 /TAXON_ID=2985 /ORGANISM="Ochromonas sp, Strain CCMP1899" /LENGTH=350 /DNA_ID=CAMNT_0006991507 /DNA_START=222 /DNA_END=1274 /DNA_ORIENTATION=-